MNRVKLLAVSCAGLTASATFGQGLLVVDSGNDRVSLLSSQAGNVLDANFLDIAAAAAAAGYAGGLTPIEAIEVGNEIWVSDQVADRIWRFDRTTRSYLGSVGEGSLDNIRGMELVGNTLYVAQGSPGATGAGIVTVDVSTNTVTGSFVGRADGDFSYWDVLDFGGELLVSNSDSGNDGIERYAYDGTFLGILAASDGETSFDFIQQLAPTSAGTILAGGFSVPAGVYEVAADGTILGTVAGVDFGPRGVVELGNGAILWTNGAWVRTDSQIKLDNGQFRYITATTIPSPAVAGPLAMLAFSARRRR